MSPKKKAIELIQKFMDLSDEQEYDTPRYMSKEMAKQSALIAVNEIKVLLYDEDFIRMLKYDYWYEVKQEIEKL
jgi:hypothetical protein